ncbi:serine/threonine protein phosphatase 1 [Selenomonas sp. GACV-9]|uniref:metallophosphoesterase n=1 Tax=Selenomonas sp. GACV-9 TaxID=3158782 RepID=UPI0008F31965|nr:serine/threonine protein phosphatase 1 [Selenomonas ruminantium]
MDKIERLLVFGDIHGKWTKFEQAYERAAFDPQKDMMVFLGDYLDRGESPVPVMKWVMAHFDAEHMIFLRGNHEQMFLDAMQAEQKPQPQGLLAFLWGSPQSLWLMNGGRITDAEIEKTGSGQELRRSWAELIERMPLYAKVETEKQVYWFMHADCNPEEPLEEQPAETLLWHRQLAARPSQHQGRQVIVLGHTPVQTLGYQAKPQWLQDGRLVLMDTGSYLADGRVTCVDLLSRTIYQSE